MQPYIFPYIGYFHLVHSVDKFIFLDDVNYINRGWINRNRISQVHDKHDYMFTIPLDGASQNKKINEIRLHENYITWRDSFHKTFTNVYRKAPNTKSVEALIFTLLYKFQPGDLISDLAKESVQACYEHIEGATDKWIASSSIYQNTELKKGERLIDICHKEKADTYHNAIGGQELYTKEQFAAKAISLKFVQSGLKAYRNAGLPGLSIIDMLCYCDQETLQKQLRSYHLI